MQYFAQKATGKSGIVGLVPTTADTAEKIRNLDAGRPVKIDIKQPRNGKHHRLFWAVMGLVADNTDYRNADAVLEAIKLRLGMYSKRLVEATDGETHFVLDFHSISYAAKDQSEFNAFYEQAKDILEQDLGFDMTEFEREASERINQ